MAISSSATSNPLFVHLVAEKLGKLNHALWKAQVLSVVHGARLQGHDTGDTKASPKELVATVNGNEVKRPNPAYEEWEAADQQVLSYLLSLLSKEVMTKDTTCGIVAAVWTEI